jgi:hypothetical protein
MSIKAERILKANSEYPLNLANNFYAKNPNAQFKLDPIERFYELNKRKIMNRDLNAFYHHEFDNYSQAFTEEDNFSTGASAIINYGDVEIAKETSYNFNAVKNANYSTLSESDPISYSYSVKTNNHLGSIITSLNGVSDYRDSFRTIYRAVEYTKSPKLERVRVKNMDDTENVLEDETITYKMEDDLSKDKANNDLNLQDGEKTFIVKLFPLDEQEKEVQEMTMFVDSGNNNNEIANIKSENNIFS